MTRTPPILCACCAAVLACASCGPTAAVTGAEVPPPAPARVIGPGGDGAQPSGDDLVMLSVGARDGVKRGYRFTVYRDERFVGKVEVVKVLEDRSIARILGDWTKEQIREGDDASTRVY